MILRSLTVLMRSRSRRAGGSWESPELPVGWDPPDLLTDDNPYYHRLRKSLALEISDEP